jgi:hypothetical protein
MLYYFGRGTGFVRCNLKCLIVAMFVDSQAIFHVEFVRISGSYLRAYLQWFINHSQQLKAKETLFLYTLSNSIEQNPS